MFERIRQSVLALGEGAGALFPFAAPFLACAPVFLFLVWFVLCLCSRRVRKGSKSAYLFVCDFFLLLFAALALFSPDALAAVAVALAVRALCTGFHGTAILCADHGAHRDGASAGHGRFDCRDMFVPYGEAFL